MSTPAPSDEKRNERSCSGFPRNGTSKANTAIFVIEACEISTPQGKILCATLEINGVARAIFCAPVRSKLPVAPNAAAQTAALAISTTSRSAFERTRSCKGGKARRSDKMMGFTNTKAITGAKKLTCPPEIASRWAVPELLNELFI